jgi:outer membrane lipoprotein SlyB
MFKTTFPRAIIIGAVIVSSSGCTSLPPMMTGHASSSAAVYGPDQAQRTERVRLGTVVSLRSVLIDASDASKAAGSGIGGLVGALAGRQIGDGKGQQIATVVGAVAGLIGGQRIAAAAYKQPGIAVTVELDDGAIVSVTQAADIGMTLGQRVQVSGNGYGVSRVTPLDNEPSARR